MDEKEKPAEVEKDLQKTSDCGCDGECCPPKKSNPLTKIIFAVIILAALAIVAVKVFKQPAPAAEKASCCPPSSSDCDTTKATTCDTTKGSSCCPKK